jgi:hypothetical protein
MFCPVLSLGFGRIMWLWETRGESRISDEGCQKSPLNTRLACECVYPPSVTFVQQPTRQGVTPDAQRCARSDDFGPTLDLRK